MKFFFCLPVTSKVNIPSITSHPIKCLGKWFDSSLTDKKSSNRLKQQVDDGLIRIDRCDLIGKFKLWIYQHGLLPRLIWPMMVNEIPASTVEKLEQLTSKYLRRWLGMPPSFTSIGLYGRCCKLQLPLSSVLEEYKAAKARLLLTLRDSKDDKIRNAGIEVRTGRKWSVSQAVSEAESALRHKDIVGTTNIGREGLGTRTSQRWKDSSPAECRQMVQEEIRRQEDETRSARVVQMGAQAMWTKWDVPERKLTWSDIWKHDPSRIQFLVRSVYDLLPSPTNLLMWNLSDDPSCPLCKKTATLQHILSSCNVALTQGRYTWRHNKVLRELADVLERKRREKPLGKPGPQLITFLKEGQRQQPKTKGVSKGILQGSLWEMSVDLDGKLVFPDVVETNLRPDIVIWSKAAKKIILVELTVPWEERIQEAYERKRAKYDDLMESCRSKGWSTWLFPVEVGCRGFPAQSVWRMLSVLGIQGKARKAAVQSLSMAAERASRWLWLRRMEQSWLPSQTSSA